MKKFLLVFCAIMSFNILTAQKNVLLEEATGTWCQYCPAGIYYIDSLQNVYDNVIAIAIHTNDVMENAEYFASIALEQAPSANIGRRYQGKDYNEWFNFVQQEMNVPAKATISIDNQFNETTRELIATVSVTALENISGNYRVAAIAYEDAVTGPAPQYNQANQFSNYYFPMGGFENLPNPVPANRMAYDHVARQLLGGYNGETGMPATLMAGETYSHSFLYNIPEGYDHNYIRIVGLLIGPDGTIDNVDKSAYLNGSDNAAPKFTSSPITENYALVNYLYNIYVHDTDGKNSTIAVEEKPEWLSFEQYDNKSAALYGMTDVPGEYDVVITVSDGEDVTTQSFTIVVSEPLNASWEYLGERGFSESSVYMYLFGSCSYNGDVYMFAKEYGCPTVYKYDSQLEQWQKIPTPSDVIAYDGSITVDNNGVVYIAYSLMGDQQVEYDDMMKIKKYENGQWTDVGNLGRPGGVPRLVVNSDNVLYLSFKDYSENNRYFVYRFYNNDWERVGGEVSGGLWAKFAMDSNDTPYISWVDSYSGNKLYVSKLVGEVWLKVGGDAVSEEGCYYYQDLAVDNDGNIYIAYCGYPSNILTVYRYNGTMWESIGSETINLAVKGLDVALDNQQDFYVAITDMNMENRLSVVKYDGEEWNFVGQRGFTDPADPYMSMTMVNDFPCVFYTDVTNGNKASSMYYMPYNFFYPPYDLKAEVVNENDIEVSWQAPQTMEPKSYNVFRNDSKVGNTAQLSYTDEDLNPGVYRYTISAVYEDGESAQAGPVTAEITVSIAENSEVAFVVYPNPAGSYVTIESVEAADVKIYSINGQMISQQNITEGINTIDMSGLKAGMYFINVNGTMVKIVKK